jgi:hypothetical protein
MPKFKKSTGFRMKGPSLINGKTVMDSNVPTPFGRTMSRDHSITNGFRLKKSPFKKEVDPEDKLISETTTMEDPVTTVDDTDTETTTKTTQKGEKTSVYEKKGVATFRSACYDENGKFIGGPGVVIDGILCELSKDPEYKDTYDVKEPINKEDVKVEPKEKKKKKCECQAYKADGSKGPMVEYPCDGPKNPNCSKPTKTKTCSCQRQSADDGGSAGDSKNEWIHFECGTPEPPACRHRRLRTNDDCYEKLNGIPKKCPGMDRYWSWKECKCKGKYIKLPRIKIPKLVKKKCKGKGKKCYADHMKMDTDLN